MNTQTTKSTSPKTELASGTNVRTPKGKGTVKAPPAKGWVTIQFEDGETKRFRPKDLTVLGELKAGYVQHGVAVYDPTRYVAHKSTKTASGRPVYDNNDRVSAEFRKLGTLDEQYKFAAEVLGVTQKSLREAYEKLNPGMQRMNLGNRVRNFRAQAKAH